MDARRGRARVRSEVCIFGLVWFGLVEVRRGMIEGLVYEGAKVVVHAVLLFPYRLSARCSDRSYFL